MTDSEWTFDQGRNVACFTQRQIIEEGAPILQVVHDAEDHSWQFLTGEAISMADAMIVGMGQIVDRDSTLLEIGGMEPGYTATRSVVGGDWVIEKDPT